MDREKQNSISGQVKSCTKNLFWKIRFLEFFAPLDILEKLKIEKAENFKKLKCTSFSSLNFSTKMGFFGKLFIGEF